MWRYGVAGLNCLFAIEMGMFVESRYVAGAEARAEARLDVGSEELRIAELMLLYQRNNGGWPKNYDQRAELSDEERKKILASKGNDDTTFDNGATHREMKHLARVFAANGDERFRRAFIRGLDFTLRAQYDNGGWPQFYPRARGYSAHITFNDGAMIGIMELLAAIARGEDTYRFVDEDRRRRCAEAIEKGLRCILKCQIQVDGRKTAWCAQHHLETLVPVKARSYELPSISGSESVGVVQYLMGIDKPGPEVIAAVQGAVAWFDEAKLLGIRVERVHDPSAPGGRDKIVVKDPTAPPLWARFNEIGTNKPIFCSRDGIPRETLAEISHERRNGYSWLTGRPAKLLAEDYPAWQKKWVPGRNVLETPSRD